jgi:transposase-like protein
MSHET